MWNPTEKNGPKTLVDFIKEYTLMENKSWWKDVPNHKPLEN